MKYVEEILTKNLLEKGFNLEVTGSNEKVICYFDNKNNKIICKEIFASGLKKVKEFCFKKLLENKSFSFEKEDLFIVIYPAKRFLKIYKEQKDNIFVPFNYNNKEELEEVINNIKLYFIAYSNGYKDCRQKVNKNRRGQKK